MKATNTGAKYDDPVNDALYSAWDQGLDYVEINGRLYGMFDDGIWLVGNDSVVLDDSCKIELVMKPSRPWGMCQSKQLIKPT